MGIRARTSEEWAVRRLCAAHRLYSLSKAWLVWEMISLAPPLIVAAIVVVVVPEASVLAAFGSTISCILSQTLFEGRRTRYRKLASRASDEYDRYVLGISKNRVAPDGELPPEIIAKHASRVPSEWRTRAKGWYSDVPADLPESRARLLCQRQNCAIDSGVRHEYISWVVGFGTAAVATISLAVVTAGLPADLVLLMLVAPSLPIILFCIREVRFHRQATDRVEKLAAIATQLLHAEKPDAELLHDSAQLQDEITAHRREDPPPFEWVYQHHRKRHPDASRIAQEELAEAIRARLSELT